MKQLTEYFSRLRDKEQIRTWVSKLSVWKLTGLAQDAMCPLVREVAKEELRKRWREAEI